MSSRDAILQRLRNRTGGELTAPECDFSVLDRPDWSTAERLDMFERTIESVHGEVHRTTESGWIDRLAEILQSRGAQTLLIAKEHEIGQALRSATKNREDLPQLLVYDEPIESWQEALFNEVDAGITSTRGGIAETGSLILWPTADEPRLMSLVPPIHIAILKASELYTTFHDAMQSQNCESPGLRRPLISSKPSLTVFTVPRNSSYWLLNDPRRITDCPGRPALGDHGYRGKIPVFRLRPAGSDTGFPAPGGRFTLFLWADAEGAARTRSQCNLSAKVHP